MKVECPKCTGGQLVPLSDYGPDGAAVMFKAWTCTHCEFTLRIDKGNVSRGAKRLDDGVRRR